MTSGSPSWRRPRRDRLVQVGYGIARRSRERMVTGITAQSRPHRGVQDVRDHIRRLLPPEHPIEVTALPQCCSLRTLVREGSSLLEHRHKSSEVTIRRGRFEQSVEVISHEAVRNSVEPIVDRGTQKLETHGFDAIKRREAFSSAFRANREEIPSESVIALGRESRRCRHAIVSGGKSRSMPTIGEPKRLALHLPGDYARRA